MDLFTRIGHEFYVLFTAALPVLELRGSVPLALTLGLSWQEAFTLSLVGNMLPVPAVILLSRSILARLKAVGPFRRSANWLERRAAQKRHLVDRYSMLGLAILVAIPLPGTGAWTGALLASLLDLRMRRALPAIGLGVLGADILVTGATYGLFSIL